MSKLKDWLGTPWFFLGQCVVVVLIFWFYERSHQSRHNKVEAQVEALTEWAQDQ